MVCQYESRHVEVASLSSQTVAALDAVTLWDLMVSIGIARYLILTAVSHSLIEGRVAVHLSRSPLKAVSARLGHSTGK